MDSGTIKVTGSGSIHVLPDVTRLEVSVDSVFPTYDEAYTQAKENGKWVVQVLEYNNKSGKLAKTTHFDISDYTVNDYDDDGHYIGQVKEGFSLSQRFKIDLGMDTVLLNKVVRGIGKYVKGAQINIGYTVQDPRPYQLKMIERAVKDAREKADIMAKAAGCTLGEVVEINYGRSVVQVYSQARNIHSSKEALACSSDSLDIAPEDLVMSDDVDVTWRLTPSF